MPGVKVVAVAKVHNGRRQKAKQLFGADLLPARDSREILARRAIEAVIIATPDPS